MEKLPAVVLAACIIACNSPREEHLTDGDITKTLAADAHGVRVTGGETSDLGGGSELVPDPCRDVETTRLSLEEARQQALPVDAKVAFLETAYEAPFRWGYDCGPGEPASSELEPVGDTRLRLQGEVVDVLRTTRTPLPGQPATTQCADRLDYRSVFALSTADGRITGRFYARFPFPFMSDLVRAWPDLRNFTGSLEVPIDPARPHWARLLLQLGLADDGILYGSLDTVVNYTDGAPGGGMYGIAGFVLSEDGEPRAYSSTGPGRCEPRTAVPAAAEPVSLDGYDGSRETPTCPVEASYYVSDLYLNPPHPDSEARVSSGLAQIEVDGVAVAPDLGIPHRLGRLPAGARIHVEMSSDVPDTMPFIGLSLGADGSHFSAYDVFAFCEQPGCVARADGIVEGCLY